jgi:hypothetical protein
MWQLSAQSLQRVADYAFGSNPPYELSENREAEAKWSAPV